MAHNWPPSPADARSFPRDDAALVAAVQEANLPTLLMVLIHLTGDASWMVQCRWAAPRSTRWKYSVRSEPR